MTIPPTRQLLHVPGRSEVTATETSQGEVIITATLYGYENRVTDLAAVAIAIANQYPDAWVDYIEAIPEGGWFIDLVATAPDA